MLDAVAPSVGYATASQMLGVGEILGGFSGFKGRLLLSVGAVVLAGMAWSGGRRIFQEADAAPPPGPSQAEMDPDWNSPPLWKETVLRRADRWGEGAVGVGASFILAMLAASILRAAFKTGLVLALLGVAIVWILESRGYVSLWQEYTHTVQEGGTWMAMRAGGLLAFLQQHLPSSLAAAVGFGFGLRK